MMVGIMVDTLAALLAVAGIVGVAVGCSVVLVAGVAWLEDYLGRKEQR
jgi:hypothetical protein